MADLLLSALIPIVVRKAADSVVQNVSEMWGIADKRERLHDKLLAVQDVLTDAEEQGEAKPAVKSWLTKLKSATYEADDVLDEFHYEELRQDAVKRGHKVENVSGFFSHENPVLFRYKMCRKLKEVVERIDYLVTEMEKFKFVHGRQGQVVDRVGTHSCVIESEIVGRGGDKEKLVKLLTGVCPTENLMVLPVVGMGGLGKTTLAQLVYNDTRVKEHFKLLVWVCVSEQFDVRPLAKLIIDTMIGKDCQVPHDNMELLQRRLREEISGKRYLLVLDDVWNDIEVKWEELRVLLNCGDLGSAVLVTTRNATVASIMGTMASHNLGYLGEEESWNVFQKRAFGMGVEECKELVEIGMKLVQKCKGLPLAIKTLGSFLSYKHEVRQWLEVLKQSTIWENMNANDSIMSVLRLSYDHLPSYMKQCFAFCAVFPKDYEMKKEKLVQYWMAHGFIPSDGPGGLEMTGSDIFNELVWRSFFQDVKQVPREYDYHSQTTCKMHDLIHDLAQSVIRDECLYISESSQINNTPQCNVRHISLDCILTDTNEAFECFRAARSLISTNGHGRYDVQKIQMKCLRVLGVSVYSIEKIVGTPGKMKHLRYLDISMLYIRDIPEAITTLYLLQTLRLNGRGIKKLPEGMRYMMSLRHLYLEDCSGLKCMPPYLGELKSLQTLTCYIVGTGVGNRIGELKTLNLGGKLEVYNLREVRGAIEAREVNMVSKQNLDQLVLCWGMSKNYSEGVRSNGSEAMVVDLEVLDALKPCNKLKVLRIKEYRGDKFPTWMTEYHMLENLVELHIIECTRCTNVPPFHRLPLLKKLRIKLMDNLRHLCCGVFTSVEGGQDATITFPSLKSLDLREMPNLDCWCEGDVGEKTSLTFPVLSNVWIIDCPKLSALPITPLLDEMTIRGNKTLSCFATGLTTPRSLTLASKGGRENNAEDTLCFKPWESLTSKPWVSLEYLEIKGFNHIRPPTDGRDGEELISVDVSATALQILRIISSNFWFSPIPSNSPLWLWKCFRFIEVLNIDNCDSLISWPEEELCNLNYLKTMRVTSCRNFLGSLTDPRPEMSTRQVLLPKLERLTIIDCPNMVEVPNLCLPDYGSSKALKKLKIESCESLKSVPSSIGGLTALKNLYISGSKKLESLPEALGSLTALKQLDILSCESLNSVPSSIGGLTALEKLCISRSKKLESLPEALGSLMALKELGIVSCESLNSVPSSIGGLTALELLCIRGCKNLASLSEGMQGLEALKGLSIWDCPKIKILPEGLLQRLKSLDDLFIIECPLLERDFREHGKYWHFISEIPYVHIGEQGPSHKIGNLTQLISSCKIPCLSMQS